MTHYPDSGISSQKGICTKVQYDCTHVQFRQLVVPATLNPSIQSYGSEGDMQAQAIIDQRILTGNSAGNLLNVTAKRVVDRMFGCWVHDLGRPFGSNGLTYRVCVKCGMSRRFDTNTFKTYGPYHRATNN